MRMSSSQRNGIILLGVVFGVLFFFVYPLLVRRGESRAKMGFAVSPEQMRRIANAISQYEKANGERPMGLTKLVEAGMLNPRTLLDERRDEPSKDGADVLYFPAVRRDDPADLVMLCTLLIRNDGEKFHAITNDGNYTEASAHDLIMALNRTYTYIGKEIMNAKSASAPAATDRTEKE